MARVAVQLRSLMGPQRVFHRQLVELELPGQIAQLVGGGIRDVDPHERVGPGQMIGDLVERKSLGLEGSPPVDTSEHVSHQG